MSCCGKHKKVTVAAASNENTSSAGVPVDDGVIYPETGCVMCAEKHLSTAFALAGEAGYVTPNRQRIVGEMTASALHLFREHKELAESIRAARHLIQQRREAEVDWMPMLAGIDDLANAEATALLRTGH
jgi:hypothetical protein